MKRSSLYNYPILVDEVEDLRKIVKELRKTIAELQETIESMNNKTEKKA
jgi:prefoldin subunit 5